MTESDVVALWMEAKHNDHYYSWAWSVNGFIIITTNERWDIVGRETRNRLIRIGILYPPRPAHRPRSNAGVDFRDPAHNITCIMTTHAFKSPVGKKRLQRRYYCVSQPRPSSHRDPLLPSDRRECTFLAFETGQRLKTYPGDRRVKGPGAHHTCGRTCACVRMCDWPRRTANEYTLYPSTVSISKCMVIVLRPAAKGAFVLTYWHRWVVADDDQWRWRWEFERRVWTEVDETVLRHDATTRDDGETDTTRVELSKDWSEHADATDERRARKIE
jgi:hypothetical protein